MASRDPLLERKLLEDKVDRLLGQATLLLHQGQGQEALKRCQEALSLLPTSASAHEVLGDIYMATAHYAEAMEAYRAGLKFDPKRMVLEDKLGRASLHQWDAERLGARTREILERGEVHKQNIRRASEVAVCLSVLCPGLGQIRNDEPWKGLFMAMVHLLLIMAMIHLFVTSLQDARVRAVNRPAYSQQVTSVQRFLANLGRAWQILRDNRTRNAWFVTCFIVLAINYGYSLIDAGIRASRRKEEELL